MKKKHKNFLLISLQIIITFVFLYLTFRNTQIKILLSSLENVNYWILFLALIPQFISLFFLALREKYLLNKIYAFKFRDLFEGVIIGMVGNNVLPLRGGEFLKVLYWSKKSSKSYISLLSVAFLERVFDLIFLIFLFFMGSQVILLKLGVNIKWVIVFLSFTFLIVLSLFFLDIKFKDEFKLHASFQFCLGEKITHFLNTFLGKVMKGFRVLGSGKNVFLASFFTVLYWSISFATSFIFLYAFHLPVSWEKVVVIILATSFGSAIPAAPGYIGTYDYFAKMALVLYGVNVSVAASFAIVTHVISLVPLTLIGMLFIYPVLGRLIKSNKAKTLC